MIKKYIKYFYPEKDSENPLESCLEQIFDYLFTKEYSLKNILSANIFFKRNQEVSKTIQEIDDCLLKFRFDVPSTKLAQRPVMFEYVFEVWFIDGDFKTVNFGDNFKMIVRNNIYILYATITKYKTEKDLDYYESAFNDLLLILKRNRFSINSIFRQWGYIGNILDFTEREQNYQRFNDKRSDIYKAQKWQYGYPAATGIGLKGEALGLSIIGLKGALDFDVYSITNPEQKEAFEYEDSKLIGKSDKKTTPKFVRAKLLITKDNFDLYISGTSAIKGQDSIDETDIVSQTQVTIDNILALINQDNIFSQIPEKFHERLKNIELEKHFAYLRIYLKNLDDSEKIREMILKVFGPIPHVFVEADICRPELLVEIEGAIFY